MYGYEEDSVILRGKNGVRMVEGRNVPLGTKRVQGESVIGSNIVEQRKLLARG